MKYLINFLKANSNKTFKKIYHKAKLFVDLIYMNG